MTRRFTQLTFAATLAAGMVSWAAPAHAQNGTMTGRIVDMDRRATDQTGKPLAGHQSPTDFQIGLGDVQVTLTLKSEPPKVFKAITDLNGDWYKSGLPPGTYDITARLEWTDPIAGRAPNKNNRVVFIATANNIVLKPGEKLIVPDMDALTEEALAAGKKPRTASAAPPPGMSNTAIDAQNKRNAELDLLLKDANALFDAKKWDDSIAKYNSVATKLEGSDQSCARCYVRVGEAYLKLKNEAEAEKAFLKAIEINPEIPEPYTNLATLYNSQKRMEDATKMSAKATELMANVPGGGDPVALYNQGVIFYNSGKMTEARDAFAKSVKSDPKNANAQFYLGLTTFSVASSGGGGAIADAKAPLQAYLSLAPTGEHSEAAKGLLAAIK